ncbi:hypothetical protein RUND412_009103 [Rhizina undulata]
MPLLIYLISSLPIEAPTSETTLGSPRQPCSREYRLGEKLTPGIDEKSGVYCRGYRSTLRGHPGASSLAILGLGIISAKNAKNADRGTVVIDKGADGRDAGRSMRDRELEGRKVVWRHELVACFVKPSFDWNLHGCDAIDFKPSIDVVFETGVLGTIDKPSKKLEGTLSGKYGSGGTWQFKKFMFLSVRFTEEKSEGQLSKMEVDNLGEIRLIVRRFVCTGSNYKPVDRDLGHEDIGRGKEVVVHEKDIKGLDITHAVKVSHLSSKVVFIVIYRVDKKSINQLTWNTRYGKEATTVKTPIYLPGRKLETKEKPFMIFRFLYTSERALKNLGFMQRTISAEPQPKRGHGVNSSSKENDLADMTHEQMKEEIMRLTVYASSRKNIRFGVKRELDSSVPAGKPKTEPGPSTNGRVKRFAEVETIDLTGDD